MRGLLRQSCHVMSGKNQATACQVTCDTSTFKIMKLHLNFITCATFPQAGRQYHIQDSSPQPVSPITCCHLDTSLVSCPHRFIPRAVDLGASGLGVDLFTSLSPPLLFFLYSYYHFFSDPSETCSNEFYSPENPCVNSRGKEVVESRGK